MEHTFETRDDFKRVDIAEKLIKVISSEIDISPIVIDGKWGTGKTEFCKKLVIHANRDEKNNYVYIDCFKYDSSDDPLLMLLTSVSKNVKNETVKKDLFQKSLPVIKVIGGSVAKAAISWGLQVKADKFLEDFSKAVALSKDSVVDGIKDTSNQLVDLGISEAFENLEQIQQNITKLREVLEKAAEEKEMVLVIDELDRCKPTFALNLLEKVKHIFDIKGIKIILSTNLSHLEAVVLQEYGMDINSEEYLRKFYKYKLVLNRESNSGYRYENNSYNEFLRQLDSREELKNCIETENNYLFFKHFILMNELSLRDMENFFRSYDVFKLIASRYQLIPQTNWLRKLYVLFGIYLHTCEVQFCEKVLSDNVTEKDVLNLFSMDVSDLKKFDGHSFQTILFFIFLRDLKESKVTLELLNSPQQEKFQTLDDFAKNLWMRAELPGGGVGDRIKILKDILKELHFFSTTY